MLKFIIGWFIVGAFIMVCCTSLDIKEDVKKFGVFGTIFGSIFTAFAAPIWVAIGVVNGIKKLMEENDEES